MGSSRDFEKEQKRKMIAKRGFECPYGELPKTGSHADQKRYFDTEPALPSKPNKNNQLVDKNNSSKLTDCPFCKARVLLITTHVENRHPEKLDEFRKSRTKKAPAGAVGLRRSKQKMFQIFTFNGPKKQTPGKRKNHKLVANIHRTYIKTENPTL